MDAARARDETGACALLLALGAVTPPGTDSFFAARAAGPAGHVIGVAMTEEQFAKARQLACKNHQTCHPAKVPTPVRRVDGILAPCTRTSVPT